MPSTQDIRRRIRSVKNTKQITKAMELVAAAKMRKAQQYALATRSYANLAWEMLKNLSDKTDPRLHKLLSHRKGGGKSAALLITSNRGLIGAFNNSLIKKALEFAGGGSEQTDVISMGKKGRDAMRKRGFNLVAEFNKEDTISSIQDIRPVSGFLLKEFLENKYGKIVVIYMDFVSTLVQKPHVRQLLPLPLVRDESLGGVSSPSPSDGEGKRERLNEEVEYLFEPTPEEVLRDLIPRLVEMQIYQAVLETNASEHSARMVAMKNASESANDLVDDLTLEYNQIRQAGITKEISEIVGGRLALEN